jgi:hypothetical protein
MTIAYNESHHYALLALAEHLFDAHQWDKLFLLARNKDIYRAQQMLFGLEPDRLLQSVNRAIQGAIISENAPAILEFLLVRADRHTTIGSENPLKYLRLHYEPSKVFALTKLRPTDERTMWYLLLAWELQRAGERTAARTAIDELCSFQLGRLAGWEAELAAIVLPVALSSDERCDILCKTLISDALIPDVCQRLIRWGFLRAARDVAETIMADWRQGPLLRAIAIAHARNGAYDSAIELAKHRLWSWYRVEAFAQIHLSARRAGCLETAAAAYEQLQRFQRKLEEHVWEETCPPEDQARALGAVAALYAFEGDTTASEKQLKSSLDIVFGKQLYNDAWRVDPLLAISSMLAEVSDWRLAATVIERLPYPVEQARAYVTLAELQAAAEDTVAARQSLESGMAALAAASGTVRAVHAVEVLSRASLVYRTLDDPSQAAATLRRAVEETQTIARAESRVEALRAIALAQPPSPEGDRIAPVQTMLALLPTSPKQRWDTDYAKILCTVIETLIDLGEDLTARDVIASSLEPPAASAVGDSRAAALCEVGRIAAQVGSLNTAELMFNTALALTIAIAPDQRERRNKELRTLAIAQAEAGLADAALQTLQQLSHGSKPYAMCEVGPALCKAGLHPIAWRGLTEVYNEVLVHEDSTQLRSDLLLQLLITQLVCGDLTHPLQHIEHSPLYITHRFSLLIALVRELVQQGNTRTAADALDVAAKIAEHYRPGSFGDQTEHSSMFCRLAVAQLWVGSIELAWTALSRAVDEARQLRSEGERAMALQTVAEASGELGNIEKARTIAHSITAIDPIWRAWEVKALRRLAIIELGRGYTSSADQLLQEARSYAKHIDDTPIRVAELESIAIAQAAAGFVQAALDTIPSVEREELRSNALATVMQAQVRDSDPAGALQTFQRILVNRDKHLSLLANMLAEARHWPLLQKVIPLCGATREAAYQFTPVIARMYPQQIFMLIPLFLELGE